ncbi:MAG: hypothetical protein E6J17_09210 [Chloroflexi bacterium]|nr:MAG: hypothetical protein E6J17_09210 [Chloroflexota bacterium]
MAARVPTRPTSRSSVQRVRGRRPRRRPAGRSLSGGRAGRGAARHHAAAAPPLGRRAHRRRGTWRLLPAAHGPPRHPDGRDRPRAAHDRPGAARGRPMSGRALVLAAHGSRRDPAANALVRRLAESIRGRRLFDEVAVAFHQGEPGFEAVLDELTAEEITVVPFLTSAGHYSEVVLPEGRRSARTRAWRRSWRAG